MGLFDFASELGKKLFGDDDDPAEKIQNHIEEDNPGVENLKVEVEDGVATVSGEAKDQSAFEKAVLPQSAAQDHEQRNPGRGVEGRSRGARRCLRLYRRVVPGPSFGDAGELFHVVSRF